MSNETLSLLLLICVALIEVGNGAYQGQPCPGPCRCLKFEGLWSVYCNVSGLNEVPKGIPTNTQLLDLAENSITKIPIGAFHGLNDLQQLDLSTNGLNELSIEEGALDLPNLQSLDLTNNGYTMIPSALPMNLTTLWILYNQITNLTIFSFKKCQSLQYLDLSNNGLRGFEPGTFDWLRNLSTLYIPFNNLTDSSFPPNLFSKTTQLQLLGMRFNQMTKLLPDLPPSIQYLDYVGNQIRTLPAFAFKSLPNLQSMEFWQGQITTIEDNAFYGLSKLTILDFMQDSISSTLTKDTFNGLTALQTLYMDLNNVSRIEPGAFRSFGSVRSLWFSSNHLSTLQPEVLDEKILLNLSEIYMDDNPWYCDCHLRWLREKVDNASYVIQYPGLMKCAGPSKVTGKSWDSLKPSDFVC